MKACSKHLVVGDVLESDGEVIAINPDDPIWRRRFTVQRRDGTVAEIWLSSILLLHLTAGSTFTRCVLLDIDDTSKLPEFVGA